MNDSSVVTVGQVIREIECTGNVYFELRDGLTMRVEKDSLLSNLGELDEDGPTPVEIAEMYDDALYLCEA